MIVVSNQLCLEMNKLIPAVVLALLAGNASASADNWTYVEHTNTAALWVQKDSIWRSGSNVKMWSMHDYAEPLTSPNSPPALSTVILFEYDCSDRRSRMLQITAYEDSKGKGQIAFRIDRPAAWTYVEPAGLIKTSWDIACKKF